MPKNRHLEKKLKNMILSAQLNIQELTIQSEKLEREYEKLCIDLETTPEKLQIHAENPTNYGQPIWEFLQNEKLKLETRYSHDADNVRDLSKLEKTFSERKSIQQHWIHVR